MKKYLFFYALTLLFFSSQFQLSAMKRGRGGKGSVSGLSRVVSERSKHGVRQDLNVVLFEEINKGNGFAVKSLLQAGASVEARNAGDFTPLHVAVSKGSARITRILLDAGANPNVAVTDQLIYPLHIAARSGYEVVVRLLLEKKAIALVMNVNGGTPRRWAEMSNHQNICAILEQAENEQPIE